MKQCTLLGVILCFLFNGCQNKPKNKPPNGMLVKEYRGHVTKVYQTSNSNSSVVYFDPDGRDTAMYAYDEFGLLFYKIVYNYNVFGLLVNTKYFYVLSNNSSEEEIEYSNDFSIKKMSNVGCLKDCFNKLYVYDRFGNELKMYLVEKNKKVLSVQNFYNKENQKVKIFNYKKGIHSSTIEYKYDSMNNPIYEYSNYFDIDRIVIRNFKYLYDKNGNWIQKIELNEYNDILEIRKRKIEYFDDKLLNA